MNPKNIISAILITLGIVVLIYSGLRFTTPGKPVEILGTSIATTDSHFIPPTAGAIMLVGGVILLAIRPRGV
jgi:membrane-bound ClpP family serine protease